MPRPRSCARRSRTTGRCSTSSSRRARAPRSGCGSNGGRDEAETLRRARSARQRRHRRGRRPALRHRRPARHHAAVASGRGFSYQRARRHGDPRRQADRGVARRSPFRPPGPTCGSARTRTATSWRPAATPAAASSTATTRAGARSATPPSSTGWCRSARRCPRCASASSATSTCAACRARRCSRPSLHLIDVTLMRVGNDEYARLNASFGASTMRNEHAEVRGGQVRIAFRGKQGSDHDVRIADRRLARIVRRCQDLPGEELFGYLDEEGVERDVALGGRQRVPPRAGRPGLHRQGLPYVGRERARSRAAGRDRRGRDRDRDDALQNTAIRVVAHDLGNTPAVCRSSYIHPAVLDAFRAGTLEPTRLEAPAAIDGLRETEAYLLDLLGAPAPAGWQLAQPVGELVRSSPRRYAPRCGARPGRRPPPRWWAPPRMPKRFARSGCWSMSTLRRRNVCVVAAGLQHLVDERLHRGARARTSATRRRSGSAAYR